MLDKSLIEVLNIPNALGKTLHARVSNFIIDGNWICPASLHDSLHLIWGQIFSICLPKTTEIDDTLIWTDSSDGHLTLSHAYDIKRSKQPLVVWDH